MIRIYSSTETNFTTNGLAVLSECKSFLTTERFNDQYEVEFEHPLDDRGRWQNIVEGNIVKNADGQLFRIYHKSKTLSRIKANARHIFYDLTDNFLENVRPTDQSGAGAIAWILTHTQYAHPFTSLGDVGGIKTEYYVRKNPVEVIMGKGGIIEVWGGELVRDNFLIKLLVARGIDQGVLVSYGKNIIGIEETINLDNLITRIHPVGKDGLMLPEKYVDSPNISLFVNPKIQEISFDVEFEADLRAAAQAYFVNTKCDVPLVNYAVDFLELSKTEEYKNYSVLESVALGDIVMVRHLKLMLDLKCKVISMIRNDLTGRIEKIELGSFQKNLMSSMTNVENSIAVLTDTVVADKTVWQQAVIDASVSSAILADLSSDDRLTAQEKQAIKKEFDAIVSEVAINDHQADTFIGITEKTPYDNSYFALSAYIVPLITDLTITTDMVGTELRSAFTAYYDARSNLLNAIALKAKSLADIAKQTADSKVDPTKILAAINLSAEVITIAANKISLLGSINIQDAAIITAKIADANITTAKIGLLAVTSAVINDLAVTTGKIDNLAVGTAQIASAAITTAKILDANITSAKIGDAQITTAKLGDAQITNAKIDRASINKLVVGTADIANASITTAKIGLLAVDSAQIALLAVDTAQIKLGAITTALIKSAAIGTVQIADGCITDGKIVNLTASKITTGTIDAASITVINLNAANITVGTINGVQITPGTVDTVNMAVNSIVASLIMAGTITGDKMVVDAITAREIASKTITANEVMANSITGAEILSGSIIADNIKAGAVTADKMNAKGLIITNANNDQTFVVGSDGSVSLAGNVQSINYSAGLAGWQLLQNGNAEINTAIVRGKVVLPNAGMTTDMTGLNPVRIWAGDIEANKEIAPFRVQQDGTMTALTGNFGGTFSGALHVGNIHIVDTNTTSASIHLNSNNDTQIIVAIDEAASTFNHPLSIGTSMVFNPALSKATIMARLEISKDANSNVIFPNDIANANLIEMYNNGFNVKKDPVTSALLLQSNSAIADDFIFAKQGTANDVSVVIDGQMKVNDKIIMGNMFIQKRADGVDFMF